MTIGEICEETGLSPRTVRYYEELGLLAEVRRRNGARRVYGPDEVQRLRFIQRLKTLGLSLAQIGELSEVYAIAGSTGQMLGRLDALLAQRVNDLDTRISELTQLRSEIGSYRAHIRERATTLAATRESA